MGWTRAWLKVGEILCKPNICISNEKCFHMEEKQKSFPKIVSWMQTGSDRVDFDGVKRGWVKMKIIF